MTFALKVHKDYRALVNEALERGWQLTVKRGGHPKLTAPDGYATPIPSNGNPSLFRAFRKRLLTHPTFASDAMVRQRKDGDD